MIKWSARCLYYKICLILLYVLFLAFTLGFTVPVWLKSKVETSGKHAFIGLWMEVTGEVDDFDSSEGTFFGEGVIDEAWFEAVRALMLVGEAFYLLGILVSLVENCFVSATSKDYGVSGGMMLFSGLCGGVSVIVFASKVEDEDLSEAWDYEWAYIITAVASGLVIFLSLVLLIIRNTGIPEEEKSSRTADYVYAHNKHMMPYHHQPEYHNAGYRGDDLPLVSRSSYHHPQPYHNGPNPYHMQRSDKYDRYDQGSQYNPYGYKESRIRNSFADGADLSNGFTPGMVRTDQVMYGGSQFKGDNFLYNGSGPY